MDPQNQVQPNPSSSPAHTDKQRKLGFLLISLIGFVGIATIVTLVLVITKKSATTNKVKKTTETSTIKPQTAYSNPFDKKSSYVNPFSSYKNPFDSLK